MASYENTKLILPMRKAINIEKMIWADSRYHLNSKANLKFLSRFCLVVPSADI